MSKRRAWSYDSVVDRDFDLYNDGVDWDEDDGPEDGDDMDPGDLHED